MLEQKVPASTLCQTYDTSEWFQPYDNTLLANARRESLYIVAFTEAVHEACLARVDLLIGLVRRMNTSGVRNEVSNG